MDLRFQLKTATLVAMLRERLAANPLPVKSIDVFGGLLVLDHYDVGRPTLGDGAPRTRAIPLATGGVHPITSPALRANVPVSLFFHVITQAKNSIAVKAGMSQQQRVEITLHFDLEYERTPTGRDVLAVAYAGFDPPPPAPISYADVDHALRQAFQLPPIDLDVAGQLGKAGVPLLGVAWVGMAAAADFSFVEMRLELQPPPTSGATDVARWIGFYDKQIESLGGEDWILCVDPALIVDMVRRPVADAVAKSAAEFRLEGGIWAAWQPAMPGVEMSLSGEVIDACIDIDLDVRVAATGRLSLQADRLRIDTNLSATFTDDWELFLCAFGTFLLWPLAGFGLVGGGQLEWYEYLGGLVGFSTVPMVSGFVLAKPVASSAPAADPCTQDPADGSHIICTFPLVLNPPKGRCDPPQGVRRATALRGIPAGLVLAGEYAAALLATPATSVTATPLAWKQPRLSCTGPASPVVATAEIDVSRSSGNSDFAFGEARAVGSFGHVFLPYVSVELDACPTHATVRLTIPISEYESLPCQILIVTSHGAHLVEFPAIAALTEDQVRDMHTMAVAERINRCYAKSRYWDIRWRIDPPLARDDWPLEQLWLVAAEHVLPQLRLRAETERGEVVARAFPNPHGVLQLGVAAATEVLRLEWESEAGEVSERDLQSLEMHARQVLLAEAEMIALAEPALAVAASREGDGVSIAVVRASGLEVHAVDAAGRMTLRSFARTPALAGARSLGRGFAAWTEAGDAFLLDRSGAAPRRVRDEDAAAVDDARIALAFARSPALRAAGWLARSRRAVAAFAGQSATPRGMLADREEFAEELVEIDDKRDRIATRDARATRLWEIDRFGARVPIAEHYARPWFAGAARTHGWLARLDESRRQVALLRVVGRERI